MVAMWPTPGEAGREECSEGNIDLDGLAVMLEPDTSGGGLARSPLAGQVCWMDDKLLDA